MADTSLMRARPQGPVGLIGLGNMGSAILARLIVGGPVVVFDLDAERQYAAAQLGALPAKSAGDVAARCETVLLSLPTPAASVNVVDELVTSTSALALVVETSTITMVQAQAMASRARALGIGYVDAAILSGVADVANGSRCFLIGGSDGDIARALETLNRICSRHPILGPAGAGMAAKVINNAVAHAVMVVLAEANALATTSGVPLDTLCELLSQEDAGLLRPLTARLAGRYRRGDFEGGMSTLAARKDSSLALEMARDANTPLFVMGAADTLYEVALAHALGDQDYASIITLWDTWRGSKNAEKV